MPPSHSLLMNTFLSSFSTPSLSLCPFSFLEMRWKTMSAAVRIRRPLQIRFQSKVPGRDSEIIFMGTGTSEGIPRVSCLTNPTKACPFFCCRFFYHSALKWFPKFGLRSIDAVIITHSHADAIGGLDDLRDWTNNVQPYIPIYVTARDFEVMKKTHYYIVDTSVVTPGAAVSELQFNIIKDEPFVVHNLEVTPLPVWHGNGYRSLGFRFGNICYISDVSELPEETYPLLNDCDLLILDALRPDRSSSTHFGLPRVRMMHLMDHEKVNQDLAKLLETEGLDVQLSYDGLRIPVNLEGFGSRCKPLSAKEFI
ncbi:hypothetical protein AMTRI_Chr05g69330 [Amborella trichopoda]